MTSIGGWGGEHAINPCNHVWKAISLDHDKCEKCGKIRLDYMIEKHPEHNHEEHWKIIDQIGENYLLQCKICSKIIERKFVPDILKNKLPKINNDLDLDADRMIEL